MENNVSDNLINISIPAVNHFKILLEDEEPGTNIRVFVDKAGTNDAEVGISFCSAGDQKATDLVQKLEGFTLYIDNMSSNFLDSANIDYKTDDMGGQLAISAPNLRGKKPDTDASLADKINYIITTEINPNLAHHGGMVSLVEITQDMVVVLQFGGGCHGCGMVDVTLKQGIEKTLKEQLPEISEVRDSTDHTTGDNPYYS